MVKINQKLIVGIVAVALIISAFIGGCLFGFGIASGSGVPDNGSGIDQARKDTADLGAENKRLAATVEELRTNLAAERSINSRLESNNSKLEARVGELEAAEQLQRSYHQSAIQDSEDLAVENREFGEILKSVRKRGPLVKVQD